MSESSVSFLLLAFLAITGLILSLPQLARLLRTRDTGGISEVSLYIGALNYVAWVVFFLATDEKLAALSNLASTLVWFGLTAAFVVLHPRVSWKALIFGLGWGMILLITGLMGIYLLSAVLTLSVFVTYSPSVWEAWRASHIGGISATSWLLYLLDGLAWLAWGLLNDSVSLVYYGIFTALASAAILAAIQFRPYARSEASLPED